MKVKKYTGDKTFMFPNAELATPEVVLEKFPAAITFPHIIETDDNEEVLFSMENLSAIRTMYHIDPELTEDEAIFAIEKIRNAEPESEPIDTAPSPEERIAAAMEYQNLLSL